MKFRCVKLGDILHTVLDAGELVGSLQMRDAGIGVIIIGGMVGIWWLLR